MKTLIVDDDHIALDLLQATLIAANYTDVTSADSAERALERLLSESTAYECFLLDIKMPGMDGIELCRIIRSMPDYQFTPIIMITALADQNSIDRAVSVGATDYVTKPFNGLELGARLRSASTFASLLRLHQQEAERAQKLKKQLTEVYLHDLDVPLPLDGGEGVLSDLQLENGLLKLPEGIYGLEVIAVAVTNIQEIYQSLTPIEFRRFLNEVTVRILSTVGSSTTKIAYFGGGNFVVIVRKLPGTGSLTAGIQSGIADKPYAELDETNIQPDFVTAKPNHPDYWSGDAAAKGLIEALCRVQNKCKDRIAQSKLTEFRYALEEEGQQSAKEWLANSLFALVNAENRVMPRRVTHEVQRDAEQK